VNLRIIAALALVGLALAGCHRSPPAAPAPPAASNVATATAPTLHLNHAQTGLPRVKLWLGNLEIDSEVCLTLPQVATGLMHREGIGPEETMLFVFRNPDQRAFYMKNVKFPISVAYIDPEGAIAEVVQLKAFDTNPVPSHVNNIQFVLEAAPDFYDRHGLRPGTVITTAQGNLQKVLAARSQVW